MTRALPLAVLALAGIALCDPGGGSSGPPLARSMPSGTDAQDKTVRLVLAVYDFSQDSDPDPLDDFSNDSNPDSLNDWSVG